MIELFSRYDLSGAGEELGMAYCKHSDDISSILVRLLNCLVGKVSSSEDMQTPRTSDKREEKAKMENKGGGGGEGNARVKGITE